MLLDTSDMYGPHTSEILVGRAILPEPCRPRSVGKPHKNCKKTLLRDRIRLALETERTRDAIQLGHHRAIRASSVESERTPSAQRPRGAYVMRRRGCGRARGYATQDERRDPAVLSCPRFDAHPVVRARVGDRLKLATDGRECKDPTYGVGGPVVLNIGGIGARHVTSTALPVFPIVAEWREELRPERG